MAEEWYRFTAQALKNVTPPDRRERFLRESITGLQFRITPTGRRSFLYRYRYEGRQRWLNLGSFPGEVSLKEARTKLHEAKALRSQGRDPAAEWKAQAQMQRTETEEWLNAPTVAYAVDVYLERYAKPRKKDWAKDEQRLNKHIIPRIGDLKLAQLDRKQITQALDQIDGSTQRNRVLAAFRKALGFAVERGLTDGNPAAGISKEPETSRERVLEDDEIGQFLALLKGAENLYTPTAWALEVMLRTGQRGGEVRLMEWPELDLEAKEWRIPKEKTKNGRPHVVPLPERVVTVLQEARQYWQGGPYVFPSPRNPNNPLGQYTFSRAIRRLTGADTDTPVLEDVKPHDLRRTAATKMTERGFNRLVVDKVLSHTDQTVGGVYDRHDYATEKRQALESWERKLDEITHGQDGQGGGQVVEFTRNG